MWGTARPGGEEIEQLALVAVHVVAVVLHEPEHLEALRSGSP